MIKKILTKFLKIFIFSFFWIFSAYVIFYLGIWPLIGKFLTIGIGELLVKVFTILPIIIFIFYTAIKGNTKKTDITNPNQVKKSKKNLSSLSKPLNNKNKKSLLSSLFWTAVIFPGLLIGAPLMFILGYNLLDGLILGKTNCRLGLSQGRKLYKKAALELNKGNKKKACKLAEKSKVKINKWMKYAGDGWLFAFYRKEIAPAQFDLYKEFPKELFICDLHLKDWDELNNILAWDRNHSESRYDFSVLLHVYIRAKEKPSLRNWNSAQSLVNRFEKLGNRKRIKWQEPILNSEKNYGTEEHYLNMKEDIKENFNLWSAESVKKEKSVKKENLYSEMPNQKKWNSHSEYLKERYSTIANQKSHSRNKKDRYENMGFTNAKDYFFQAETAIYENNKNEACILVDEAKQEIDNWFATKLESQTIVTANGNIYIRNKEPYPTWEIRDIILKELYDCDPKLKEWVEYNSIYIGASNRRNRTPWLQASWRRLLPIYKEARNSNDCETWSKARGSLDYFQSSLNYPIKKERDRRIFVFAMQKEYVLKYFNNMKNDILGNSCTSAFKRKTLFHKIDKFMGFIDRVELRPIYEKDYGDLFRRNGWWNTKAVEEVRINDGRRYACELNKRTNYFPHLSSSIKTCDEYARALRANTILNNINRNVKF